MAFASGRLEVKDMVKLGLLLNLAGVVLLLLAMPTLGTAVFGLGAEGVPVEWMMTNATAR